MGSDFLFLSSDERDTDFKVNTERQRPASERLAGRFAILSVIFQKLGRRDAEDGCHLEQRFKRNASRCAGTFDLRDEVHAFADLLSKDLLCISCLLAEIGDLQAQCLISFRKFGFHQSSLRKYATNFAEKKELKRNTETFTYSK